MADNITLEQLRELAAKSDERLDRLELNLEKGQNLLLSQSGWTIDSGDENFPYRYVLSVEGVTTASRADAVLDDSSIAIASACGVSTACHTADGTVVFKSYSTPTADLTGVLYIKKEAATSGT